MTRNDYSRLFTFEGRGLLNLYGIADDPTNAQTDIPTDSPTDEPRVLSNACLNLFVILFEVFLSDFCQIV